jgi:cyclin-dependent kinase 10
MKQLFTGIQYCHEQGVIHRDLKLSNLLLTAKGILKIADFGLARSMPSNHNTMTPRVVTLWYRAPELLFGAKEYTFAIDMWSSGCILAEFIRHFPLLPGSTEAEQIVRICGLLGAPHERIWPSFKDLPLAKTMSFANSEYIQLSMVTVVGGLRRYAKCFHRYPQGRWHCCVDCSSTILARG